MAFVFLLFYRLATMGSWAHGGLCGGDDDDHMLKPQKDWLPTILFYFC
jgi:hypothetical protein